MDELPFPRREYLSDRQWRMARLRRRIGWPWLRVPFVVQAAALSAAFVFGLALLLALAARAALGAGFAETFEIAAVALAVPLAAIWLRVLTSFRRLRRHRPEAFGGLPAGPR